MKILEVKDLPLSGLKTLKFAKFKDERGYFCESFRVSDIENVNGFENFNFQQSNESFSRKNTIRGLHFQWSPKMGKLVRTITGHMIDIALDIRKGSPTFGKVLLLDMQQDNNDDFGQWIWLPPGFAHGNFFLEDTIIEYFCTVEYNPECEAAISPLSEDISWSMANSKLKKDFEKFKKSNLLISEKDKNGYSLQAWSKSRYSKNFPYSKLRIR